MYAIRSIGLPSRGILLGVMIVLIYGIHQNVNGHTGASYSKESDKIGHGNSLSQFWHTKPDKKCIYGKKNQGETDNCCGGPCTAQGNQFKCDIGKKCKKSSDCKSNNCNRRHRCGAPPVPNCNTCEFTVHYTYFNNTHVNPPVNATFYDNGYNVNGSNATGPFTTAAYPAAIDDFGRITVFRLGYRVVSCSTFCNGTNARGICGINRIGSICTSAAGFPANYFDPTRTFPRGSVVPCDNNPGYYCCCPDKKS